MEAVEEAGACEDVDLDDVKGEEEEASGTSEEDALGTSEALGTSRSLWKLQQEAALERAVESCKGASMAAEESASVARTAWLRATAAMRKVTCRLLVKYPLGLNPMEMWVTAPMHLECRPAEVIECFTRQLAKTRHEKARRKLDPATMILAHGTTGAALSVAQTLRASRVAGGDVLLLLPSVPTLQRLVTETQATAKVFASQQIASEKKENDSVPKSWFGSLFSSQASDDKTTGAAAAMDKKDSSSSEEKERTKTDDEEKERKTSKKDLVRGDACWVDTEEGWRRATVESEDVTSVVLVRWIFSETEGADEPRCAQVGASKIRAAPPPKGALLFGEDDDDDNDDDAAADPEKENNKNGPQPKKKPMAGPRSLDAKTKALRVQIVWRLGDPAEALVAWLRVPGPHGSNVKPRALLKKFAKKLAIERPKLRWRVSADDMCLATLDGAPLDESLPVAASLAAMARKRRRAALRKKKSTTKKKNNEDNNMMSEAFEEVLLCLPRIDKEALGLNDFATADSLLEQTKDPRRDRRGWLIEADGTLTSCTLLRGRSAPSRNLMAATASPSVAVLLEGVNASDGNTDKALLAAANQKKTLKKSDEASEKRAAIAMERAALRAQGGDAVLVETDRRAPGHRTRLRQVKLSQIIFADEVERGVGPYANKKPSGESEAPPLVGPLWYDDRAGQLDLAAIDDLRDKLLIQSLLPEFRRNGKLVYSLDDSGEGAMKRGQVLRLVFPYNFLGICLALAEEETSDKKKVPRRAIVVDSIGPQAIPRAQVCLAVGDELLSVDGDEVEATLEGYQATVARLRCGPRPVVLAFRKVKDALQPTHRVIRVDSIDDHSTSSLAPDGNLKSATAHEVSVVDLTYDDCCDDDEANNEEPPPQDDSYAGADPARVEELEQGLDDDDDDDHEKDDDTSREEEKKGLPTAPHTSKEEDPVVAAEEEKGTEDEPPSPEEKDDDTKKVEETTTRTPPSSPREPRVFQSPQGLPMAPARSPLRPVATTKAAEGEVVEDEDEAPPRSEEGMPPPTTTQEEKPKKKIVRPPRPMMKAIEPIPFERTPRPMQPLSRQVEEHADFAGALLEAAAKTTPRLALLSQPVEPSEEIQFQVFDRRGRYRACLCQNGTVRNNRDDVLGYINSQTMQAGSATEEFLGELARESITDIEPHARGPFDELCGIIDLARSRLRDGSGGTIIQVNSAGELRDSEGSIVGHFDPFAYNVDNAFKVIALYLTFIDPGMTSKIELPDDDDEPSPQEQLPKDPPSPSSEISS